MHDLYLRLESTRKRVIVQRQLGLLERLLQSDEGIGLDELRRTMRNTYADRKEPQIALSRDLMRLFDLGAIHIEGSKRTVIRVNLDWPMQITESDFFELLEKLPKSKTHRFLASAE